MAALAKSRFPGASALGLKALLLRTVDAKPAFASNTTAGGRLNANAAVRCSSAPKAWLQSPQPGFKASVGEPVAVEAIGVSCAEPAGAVVTATANGTPIALTSRGDGLYTGVYTPSAPGAVTIEAVAAVGASTDRRTASGTIEKNYRWSDGPYAWIDATAGGTRLTLGDDTSATVSLPFTFSFYEQPFSSLKVSSNGYVVFGPGAATTWMNEDVPSANTPNGFAAPYFDDLNPAAGGAVWYRTVGSAPNRKLVVSWVGVAHYSSFSSSPATFQVVLEEGTNDLVFQYQDVDFDDEFSDYGVSATVGVENLAGTIGRKFSFDQAVLQPYQGTKSIRFTMTSGPPDTTAPAAPTGLTATAGNAQVALDWGSGGESDLAGYRVYRRNADGTWPTAPLASVAASAHTDTGLANGTTYTYRVTAYDASGNESAPSGTASATPTRAARSDGEELQPGRLRVHRHVVRLGRGLAPVLERQLAHRDPVDDVGDAACVRAQAVRRDRAGRAGDAEQADRQLRRRRDERRARRSPTSSAAGTRTGRARGRSSGRTDREARRIARSRGRRPRPRRTCRRPARSASQCAAPATRARSARGPTGCASRSSIDRGGTHGSPTRPLLQSPALGPFCQPSRPAKPASGQVGTRRYRARKAAL